MMKNSIHSLQKIFILIFFGIPLYGSTQDTLHPAQEFSVQFYQGAPAIKNTSDLGIGMSPYIDRDEEKTAFQFEIDNTRPVQEAVLFIYMESASFAGPVKVDVAGDNWTTSSTMELFPVTLPGTSPSTLNGSLTCTDCGNTSLDLHEYKIDLTSLMTAANIQAGTDNRISFVLSSTQNMIIMPRAWEILLDYPEYAMYAHKLVVTYGTANTPPVASAVSFSGTLQIGQELTGTYTYTDADSDPQSGSTFKWYRSDNGAGLNKAAIGSANATTYTLAPADAGKYISFEVTPHDGTDAGTPVESSIQGPVLLVTTPFSGTLDNTRTFKRPYRICEADYSCVWTKQLLPADFSGPGTEDYNYLIQIITPQVSGNYSIEVKSATIPHPDNPNDTYIFLYSSFDPLSPMAGLIIANDDISADNVKSKINSVPLTAGESYVIITTSFEGGTTGPVTYEIVGPGSVNVSDGDNTPPVASAVSFSGTLQVGQELTGTYTYTDADNDPQSGSTFKWYRSDNGSGLNKTPIGGANTTTYTLVAADEGKYISFEVTPHDGTDAGAAVESAFRGPVSLPLAAKARSYTAYLGADGTATVSPADIDNGGAGYSTLFLDRTDFGCADIGYGVDNTWETLGGIGISPGSTDYHSLATAPDGTLYLAYRDGNAGNKTTVLRWDGSGWSALGGVGISAGSTSTQSLAVGPDGTLYVAYGDGGNGSKTTVMRWDGSGWSPVGTAGISAGGAYYQSLAAGRGDTLYVAYRDSDNGLSTTVMRWDGSAWSALGGVGISAGSATNQSLAVGPDGTPYVAYLDIENDYKTTVLRWDGSVWSALGGAGISVGSSQFQRIAVGLDGTVYVAYQSTLVGDPAYLRTLVLRWDGSAWSALGGASGIASIGSSTDQSLTVAPDGTVYLACRDWGSSSKTSVFRWDGSVWSPVAARGISAGAAYKQSLVTGPDGTVYVAYQDDVNGGKATVHRWLPPGVPVTLGAVSASDDTAVARSFVTVLDTIRPQVVVRDIDLVITDTGTVTVADINNGSTDNCGIDSMWLDKTVFTTADLGDQTVTLTVADVNGNISSATATVRVRLALVAQVRNYTAFLDANGTATVSADSVGYGSTGYAGLLLDRTDFSCDDLGAGGSWETLGNDPLDGEVYDAGIAAGNNGKVYIAFQDRTYSVNQLRVLEWDGTDWNQLGPDFPWISYRKALAVGPDGYPYVAYDEPNEADGLKVARWDGAQWILLDNHVTPSVDIWSVDMKFSPDGTLYVAYHDGDNGNITNVKRWTGSAWEQLGNDGIEVFNTGWQSLAFGGGDTVYAGFIELDADWSNGTYYREGPSVYCWDGTSWHPLGDRVLSFGHLFAQAGYLSMVTDAQGVPHIAYNDVFRDEKAIVRKWNGTTWEFLGNELGVSENRADYTSLAVGAGNALTLAYGDYNTDSTKVLQWDGSQWLPLGVTGAGDVYGQQMTSGPDGVLYVSQQRNNNDAPFVIMWQDGIPVTLTAYNNYGDTVQAGAIVRVLDTLPPVVQTQNLTVYLDTAGQATLLPAQVDNASSDNCGIDSLWLDVTSFDCSNTGANTVTLSVRDSSGNIGTGTASVTVADTLAPVVWTRNIVAYLDTLGNTSVTAAQIDSLSSDNCGIDSLWLDVTSFACGDTGVNAVTLFVRDSSGNVGAGVSSVTVLDTLAPVVWARDLVVYLDAAGVASVLAADADSASSDNCGIDSLWLDVTDFSCADIGTHTLILSARDSSGNTTTGTLTVTVADTVRPVVVTQPLTVFLDGSGNAAITAGAIDNSSTDNCGIDSIWLDVADFSCNDIGANMVTLSVRDSSGNIGTGTAIVTVEDTVRPVVVTQELTVYLDGSGNGGITISDINNGSSDNCGIDSLWLDVSAFSCNNTGANTVTLFVRDSSGNINSGTASVTVSDTTRPVVVTQPVMVYLDGSGNGSISTYDINNGSSDNCGIDSMWLDVSAFSCNNAGANPVTLFVRDSSGNINTGTSVVTVTDTTRPVVVTQPLTVYLDGSGNGSIAVGQINNGSSDNCGIDSLWLDVSAFSCNNTGINTVTLFVRDSSGNINTGTAVVTVEDTIRPVVVTQALTLYLDGSGNGGITISDINNGSSDNCGIDSLWLSITDFSCNDLGVNTVTLAVRDSSGNIGTGTASVTVADTTRPVVVTQPFTVYLDGSGNGSITASQIDNGSSDNCGIDSLWLDVTSFGCNNTGANVVTLSARDSSGNIGSGTATVTVVDTVRPVVSTRPVTVYLDGAGNGSFIVAAVNNGSTDACGIDSMWVDNNSFGCTDTGVHNITLFARDSSGNTGTGIAVVTVRDTISPVAIARNLTLHLDDNGTVTITAADANNGSYDNCGVSLSLTRTTFTCVQTGLNLETLIVTDPSGNVSTAQVLVTVLDTIRPQVRTRNLVLVLDNQGKATLTASQLDSGSTDNCTNLLHFAADRTIFTCADTGANTVLLTVTDNKNNSATATATVTVRDMTPPVVQTRNITVYLDGSGKATATAQALNNGSTDNCGIDALYLDRDTFSCAERGQNTVRLYARDYSGNESWSNAVITVVDTTRPVVQTRDTTIYLDGAGMASVTVAAVNNGSSDNCGITSLVLDKTTFNCTNRGANTVTLTATDASGNIHSGIATVTVLDTIRPVVGTKNITVPLNASGIATITTADINDGSTDNCGIQSLVLSRTSFGCADTGNNLVWLTVTDVSGNRDSLAAIVRVVDQSAPVALARNITVYLDGSGNAAITAADVDNGSTDNCSIMSRTLDKTTFNCTSTGNNLVYLTVTDSSGNSSQAQAMVMVTDSMRPVVLTKNITVYLNASGNATITAADVNNGSTDNCGIVSLSLDKATFDCTSRGANTVTLTAADASGNIRTGTATVTVLDTLRPVVRTKNITVALNASGSVTIATADINDGSTDNCGIQGLALSRTIFSCADTGNNTVRLIVTDVAGNKDSATAIVRVVDQTAPLAIARNITVYLNAGGTATITAADVDNGSSDNCSIMSRTLDKTTFNCTNTGNNLVHLTVTDSSGNSSFAQALVTVLDTVRPVVMTRNLTRYLNASGTASITAADVDNGSSDNCGITTRTIDKSSFNCVDTGINTVTLTVTDGSGNSRSATAVVTVRDTIRPVLVVRNPTIYLNAGGTATLTVADVNNGSSDNCGIQSMSLSKTTFDCSDKGANIVTLTVTDVNGNISTVQVTVTVADQMPPVVNTRNLAVYLDGSGSTSITPAQVNNNSTDNCGIQTLSLDINVFDCADLGANTVTLTVTDSSGNSAQKTAIVTIHDTIRPVIDNLPAAITAYVGAGQCSVPVQWAAITASDNCTGTQVQTSHLNGGIFAVGTTTVTVTARDGSNNLRTGSFTVTVADTVSPVFSNIPAMFTIVPDSQSCGATVSWVEPFAVDNCGTPVITKTHTPGSTFPVGNTVVSYTATDAYNNSTTINFTVVVRDEVAPAINWRGGGRDIIVAADNGRCDASVTFSVPVATDNCSGVTLTGSHQSGDRFPVGVTTVTFTAEDAAGNRTAESFTVTVEDRQAPVAATVPADDTVGICDAAYTYTQPAGTDNCGPVTVTRIAGLPSGNVFPIGTTVNTFELKDASGNTTMVSFRVTVLPQGEGQLPSLTQICVYESPVDLTLGQNNIQWSGKGVTSQGSFDPAMAGTGRHVLSYTYTDGRGCSATGTIAVTVLPEPVKPVVSRIGSTTLTTGNYISYQWYRNGHLIPGATTQQYTYTEGGNYQVIVSNAEGCTALSDDHVIGARGGGVGISDQTVQGDLLLYPNPSTGMVTIEVPEHWREDLHIEGYSTTGQRILSRKVQYKDIERIQLDLGDLPRGMYYLYFTSGSHTTTRKVTLR